MVTKNTSNGHIAEPNSYRCWECLANGIGVGNGSRADLGCLVQQPCTRHSWGRPLLSFWFFGCQRLFSKARDDLNSHLAKAA